MIDRLELLELAREFSLRPDVVEKDYALPSSLLMGYLYQRFGAGLTITFGAVIGALSTPLFLILFRAPLRA